MGLIQNKVTVSQPNSHVVVKNAGGLRGLTGETGPQGPQGVPGEAATVTAGTTTTLPAGSNATVQNVGSTSAAIFNFGIPKGDKGDTGETGTAATISVGTTTTLEPGEDATVTNSGTSSAAVFDFGIPKGAKGDTGSQGPAGQDGADGFSPTATVSKTGDTATITITDKDGTTTAQISDGVTPTIDPALSPTSENPVQNKVVTNALAGKADKPIVVSSLPATGTAGQEYFVDDRYNTVTELKGDTQQTTYSGKNLFDDVLDIQYPDSTIMKVTTDPKIGSVTMEALGSAGSQTAFFNIEVPDANSTYCLSGVGIKNQAGSSLGSDGRLWVRYRVSNNGTSWTGYYTIFEQIPSSVGQQYTFSGTISGYKYYQFLFYNYTVNGAPTGEKTTYTNIQLEKSSTPTSFEPYVGGTASPNPDYPQNVNVVTGEQSIEVRGSKNLFNVSSYDGITQNTDGTVKSTKYYTNATAVSLHLEPSTRYTISIRNSNGELNGQGWGIAVNGTWINTTSGTGAVTTDANGDVTLTVGASSYGAIGGYNAFFQLEKGNQATTYEPYKGVTKTVNLGKNLFDKDNANTIAAYIQWTDPRVLNYSAGNSSVYIPCQPNTTYTISKVADNVFRAGSIEETPTTGITVYNAADNPTGTSITIATSSKAKYLVVFLRNNSSANSLETILASLQIEKGSTATTYAPYFTPIELCKIGTYQDKIYKSGEDWYIHKETGNQDMSALSGLSVISTGNFIASSFASNYGSVIGEMLSNIFTYSATGWEKVGKFGIAASGNLWAMTGDSTITTANIATWLANKGAVVYYALATPTDTQITNADLITQLDALAVAKIMVDGGTATVTSQYLPATLTTAYNSNSGYIDYIYDGTNFVKVR